MLKRTDSSNALGLLKRLVLPLLIEGLARYPSSLVWVMMYSKTTRHAIASQTAVAGPGYISDIFLPIAVTVSVCCTASCL